MAEVAGRWGEQGCLFAYLLFLVFFPLAMGGRELWAQPLALGWGGMVLGVFLASRRLQGRWELRWHWSYLFFLIPFAYSAVQAWSGLPLFLAPATAKAWTAARQLGFDAVAPSLSLSPVETWHQSRFFLMLGLFYFLGLNLCRHRREIIFLAIACLLAGVINALVGFYPEFTNSKPWYWEVVTTQGLNSGTFLNRNHFACLMTMGILVALGLLFGVLSCWQRRAGSAIALAAGTIDLDRETRNNSGILAASLLSVALFVLVVGQVFSLSRSGLLTMLPAALGLFSWWLYRGSRQPQKRHLLAGLIVLLGAMSIALYEAAGRLGDRYAELLKDGGEQMTMGGRLLVWHDLLPMLNSWWLTGVGGGALGQVSPRFESGWSLGRLAIHAHNDWLEALIEFGLPVAGGLMIFFIAWLVIKGRRLQTQADRQLYWTGLGALLAIIAVLAHETVDYSLQAPAAALLFVALLVLLARAGTAGAGERSRKKAEVLPPPAPGAPAAPFFLPVFKALTVALAISLLIGLACAYAWPRFQWGLAAARFRNMTSELALQDRVLGERDLRFFIQAAETVLAHRPSDLETLRQRTFWQHRLALWLTTAKTAKSQPEIHTLLTAARDDLRRVCSHYPTNGYYQLLYAQIADQCAWQAGDYAGQARFEPVYDLAHANFPTLATVTGSCAQRYWQTYGRLRAGGAIPSLVQAQHDKALATWREAVSQDPASIAIVLPLIWQVEPTVAGLRELTPLRLVSQQALFAFLMDQQQFAEALATLQIMEKLNQTRPTLDDVKKLPLAELYRLDRRSRPEVARLIQEQTLIVLGLMEAWPARARQFAVYQQALDDLVRQELVRLQATATAGDLYRRETTLRKMLQQNPVALEPRIPLAEVCYILGKSEEATAILMPLAYRDEPVPRPLLESALAILRKWAPATAKKEFSRQGFLALALQVQLAELDPGTSPQHRQTLLAELAAQETQVLLNPHNVWIQRHLIPYYAGRLQEAAGDPTAAAQAYRRCLEISPNNLFAQTRLARCGKGEAQRHKGTEAQSGNLAPEAPEEGTRHKAQGTSEMLEEGTRHKAQGTSEMQNSKSDLQPKSPTPILAPQVLCRYGEALALASLSANAARVERTGTVEVTQAWLCTGDITRDYAIVTRYRQGDQLLFSDQFSLVKLATAETPMVSWRVGELVPLTRTVTPMIMSARSRTRLGNGKIDAEIVLQALTPGHPPPPANPPTRVPLFVVGE
jgi:tetratricopeptide (TPR) repeat protein